MSFGKTANNYYSLLARGNVIVDMRIYKQLTTGGLVV